MTKHPAAEWLARQITEAFPWATEPKYLIRDNDGAYGLVFTARVKAVGIRDRPISPGSPWQNGYAERAVLHHTDPRVTSANYNRATCLSAAESFLQVVRQYEKK